MRRPILAVLAACLTAVALPLVADAAKPPPKPPGNPGPGGVDLTIAANPGITIFQGATVISGKLKGPNNNDRKVTLREDLFPFNSINNVVIGKTDANGAYSFTRFPAKNSTYQVLAGANVRSPGVFVPVRVRTSLFISDLTPRVGQVVRFSGRACPTHDGLGVGIQRQGSKGFGTIRSTTLRSATRCSVYSRLVRITRDGTFREITAGHGDHARGISRSVFVNAHS